MAGAALASASSSGGGSPGRGSSSNGGMQLSGEAAPLSDTDKAALFPTCLDVLLEVSLTARYHVCILPQTHRRSPHLFPCQMSPVLLVETGGKRELPFLLQTASPVTSTAGACARTEQHMDVFRRRMEDDVSQHALSLLELGVLSTSE